ncbi:hypothetical protein G6F43_009972 [Rhizopus delemar]|nr:hypothetical protein G6F43_009972 [Rhizopus delemar]
MTTYEPDVLSDTESITFQSLPDSDSVVFQSLRETNIPSFDDNPSDNQGSSLIFDLTQEEEASFNHTQQQQPVPGSSIDNSIAIDDDIFPFFEEAGINEAEGLRMLGIDVETIQSQRQPSSSQWKKRNDTFIDLANKRQKTDHGPIRIDDDDQNACLIDLTEENDDDIPPELIDLEEDDYAAYWWRYSLDRGNNSSSSSNGSMVSRPLSIRGSSSGYSMYASSSRNPLMAFDDLAYMTNRGHHPFAPNRTKLAPKGALSVQEIEDELRNLLENITDGEPPPPEDRTGTPELMSVNLLEHQKIGLQWMAKMEGSTNKGGILADDMGLGKTIQALAIICQNPCTDYTQVDLTTIPASRVEANGILKVKTTLIVCPVSLIDQWRREVESKTSPSLKVLIYHGNNRITNPYHIIPYDVMITSYTIAATDFFAVRKGPLSKVKFHRVILDEAHTIKNQRTKAARACCDLEATYRWCMTATPVQNKVEELYSLIKFLRIRPFCEWEEFRDAISKPIKRGNHIKAIKAAHVLMKAISLRRSKKAMIDGKPILDLPERNIHMTHIDFSEDEREHYHLVNSRAQARFSRFLRAGTIMKNYSSILVLLLRLRQACLHPSLTTQKGDIMDDMNSVDVTALAEQMKPEVVRRLLSESATIKEIECPICMDVAQNAQLMMDCGHILCKECFDCYWNTLDGDLKRCPHCRGPIDRQRLVDIESFLKVHAPDLLTEAEQADEEEQEQEMIESDEATTEITSSAKIDKLLEILDETARESDNQDKTIIFTQFTTMLDLLERPLQGKGHRYLRYDGSMDIKQRANTVNMFFDDPNIKVLLVSTKCGSLGLNLTCANRVILLDVWWNPAIENQAIDRVHRIGQTKSVHVHRIFIKDTVEDRILELQNKKQAIADGVLGEGSSNSLGRLNAEEIIYLFRGGDMPANT